MKIDDVIWGDFEIKENVLIELINCKSIQRLKRISQHGCKQDRKWGQFTRYEHSIGVFLL